MKQQLEHRLKFLGLEYTALHIDHLVGDASRDNISYLDFLINLVDDEWEQQEKQLLEKRIQKARSPFSKSISDFVFEFQPSVNEKRVKETLTCRFIDNGRIEYCLVPPEWEKHIWRSASVWRH
nr:ATP-binding protein [Macrococcus brunensis]